MKARWSEKLESLHACSEAVVWARTQPNLKTAWQECERGDWMLWLLGRTSCRKQGVKSRGPLVLAACACARLSLKYVKKGETRPLKAIQTAERWARGKATIEEVYATAAAADAAAAAADAAYAAYAYAYAYAAYAAAATADAATAAYAAAAAAATAAYAAAAAAARSTMLKRCAVIVRKHFPNPPKLRIR